MSFDSLLLHLFGRISTEMFCVHFFQNEAAGMGYRDGFGTTRSVKKVYLWETGEEGGRSLPGRVRGGRRGNHHPLATNTPPSSSSPSPPSSSPSPPTTPPPCSFIYRTWTEVNNYLFKVPNCWTLKHAKHRNKIVSLDPLLFLFILN